MKKCETVGTWKAAMILSGMLKQFQVFNTFHKNTWAKYISYAILERSECDLFREKVFI
jgi:hypothetical protein